MADEAGNTFLIVLVEFFTKYVRATPDEEQTAQNIADAPFMRFCTSYVCDRLWSNTGFDLISEVMEKLSKWRAYVGCCITCRPS